MAAAVGVLVGGALAAAAFLLFDGGRDGSRTLEEASAGAVPTGLTPFEEELLPHIPDELQADCRHVPPLTTQFDATLSCPGGVASALTYSHARSGFHLYNFFVQRMARVGLPEVEGSGPGLTGRCDRGRIPAANTMIPFGLSGRAETSRPLPRDERLGYVLCYEEDGRAYIEWMTNELGVYTIAAGDDLAVLYEWWQTEAGPEP